MVIFNDWNKISDTMVLDVLIPVATFTIDEFDDKLIIK